MKYYYLIKTTNNEYSSSYKKICESFDEAKKEVPNYADWYCEKGCCTVECVDSNFNRIASYRVWKGKFLKESY